MTIRDIMDNPLFLAVHGMLVVRLVEGQNSREFLTAINEVISVHDDMVEEALADSPSLVTNEDREGTHVKALIRVEFDTHTMAPSKGVDALVSLIKGLAPGLTVTLEREYQSPAVTTGTADTTGNDVD